MLTKRIHYLTEVNEHLILSENHFISVDSKSYFKYFSKLNEYLKKDSCENRNKK